MDRNEKSGDFGCGGACWAFAVTSMLSDRLLIQRDGRFPEVNLSPQYLLTCSQVTDGCSGGSMLHALHFIRVRVIIISLVCLVACAALYSGEGDIINVLSVVTC
jgi:hypothetical protein